eukprot:3816417-Alexandrium_andersonii.AAC.1
MSASLVGSEMCIRDRESAGSCRKLLLAAFHLCGPGRSRAPRLFPRAARRTCLLYTSDAADDM